MGTTAMAAAGDDHTDPLVETSHEVLDRLLADGPVVVFWTDITPADLAGGEAPTTDGGDRPAAYLSPSVEAVFGYPRHEVPVRGFWVAHVHPDDLGRVISARDDAMAGRRSPARATYRFQRAEGDYRWVESVVNVVPGDEATGRPDRLVGFTIDITEQHEADEAVRQRERRLTEMFDGAPAQIYAKDLDGRYILVNRDVLDLWGKRSDEVLGRTDHDLWPEYADTYRANDVSVAEGGVPIVRDEVVTLGDQLATYLSLKFPLRDDQGRVYATAGVSADISDRARSVDALAAAKEAADRANVAKSEFLSRMSHELRTPLNSILGFGQLLELAELGEEDRESVTHILTAGRHLLDLIDEVLDIARIEAGRLTMSIEPVQVGEVVAQAITLIDPTARNRAIVINQGGDAVDALVRADRQRLLQVLLNLLSNAVKYNRLGGTVHVDVAHADGGRTVRLSVQDTGRGIAPADQQLVFEAFERLDAASAGIEGTGVGLALTKHLIELMGGSIGLASEPGHGSTFWVALPATDAVEVPASLDPPRPDVARPDGDGLTVLHIEDNITNVALVERVAALRPGTTLLTALQGSIGLDLARQHLPDLILLDLHLPDIDGREVLRRLRADPATASIPVVVVTADATAGQRTRLLREGARGYLTKPIDVRELLEALDAAAPG
jgi:PAS domain S-box-containing protein